MDRAALQRCYILRIITFVTSHFEASYMNKLVGLLLILTLLTTFINSALIHAAEQKTAIAVYQLKAERVSENMTNILSDVMRNAIFNIDKYEMLTKEDMKKLLENIATRQQITADCYADKCLAAIADALGLEQMITGNIGKPGNTYVINLRLVNAELADTKNILSET